MKNNAISNELRCIYSIFGYELLDFLRVLFREIDIGVCMAGVGDCPELFGGWFGIVQAVDHFCGDVCVFFAMDEENGFVAFGDLLQWGCLTECPSVFHAAETGGDVHEREGG